MAIKSIFDSKNENNVTRKNLGCIVIHCEFYATCPQSRKCIFHNNYEHLNPELLRQWANKYWYHCKVAEIGMERKDEKKVKWVQTKKDYELLPPGCIERPEPPLTNEELKKELDSGVTQKFVYTIAGWKFLEQIEQIEKIGIEKFVENVKKRFNRLKQQSNNAQIGKMTG